MKMRHQGKIGKVTNNVLALNLEMSTYQVKIDTIGSGSRLVVIDPQVILHMNQCLLSENNFNKTPTAYLIQAISHILQSHLLVKNNLLAHTTLSTIEC